MPSLSSIETWGKIAVILLYTAFIWHCHTIYDEAHQEKAAVARAATAEKAEGKMVEFNTKIEKVYVKVKDNCLDKPVPADVQRLLK